MPSLPVEPKITKKRKSSTKENGITSKRRVVAEPQGKDTDADTPTEILQLEDQISESRKYYNNIAILLSKLNIEGKKPNLTVAVSLCRVFCRLISGGSLSETNRAAQNEKIIVAWLKERCQEYERALLVILRQGDPSSQVCMPIFFFFFFFFFCAHDLC